MENEESFLSLVSGQSIESLLTQQEALQVQIKLWDILAKRAESYTMGGSSSVRVETAQELLKSAGFVLRHGINTMDGRRRQDGEAPPETVKAHLLGDEYDSLFKAGMKAIERLVNEGQVLLETANKTALAVENRAYRDTLRELGVFFKRYHYHHFAHEIPCMLDYPLAHPVDEALLGIDYINEYLRRLIIENEFCSHFETDTVISLLRSISPDHKDNHLNIFEVVAANALALTFLKGQLYFLDVTEADRERLLAIISPWQQARIMSEFQAASVSLCAVLDINNNVTVGYLSSTITALMPRLQQCMESDRLDNVFPSLYREPDNIKPAVTYIDGALMDADALRKLIDEITSCRYVSDKIALVKQKVHSLRDYIEILNICFWDEECLVLFDSLSKEELKSLRLALKQKQSKSPEWTSETGWENYLLDYVEGK